MMAKLSDAFSDIKSVFMAEIKKIFSDQGVLVFFFLAVISYSLIYPVPFYHQLARDIPVAVVDQDNTMLSRQLLRFVDASEAIAVKKKFLSLDDARASFRSGETEGIVYIPQNFEKKILRNEKSNISLYVNAGYFLLYRQVFSGVSQAAGTLSAGIEIKKLMSKGMPLNAALAVRDPVPLESVPLYNRMASYGRYLIPVVFVIIFQQTMLIGIGLLGGTARERNQMHYLVHQVDSGYGAVTVILGKGLLYFIIYAIHSIYYFEILFRIYSYPMHASILTVLLFFTPYILSVSFLAMILSTVFRSRESSILFLLCTTIPFVMLSGFSWPPESIPHWLRALSFLVPSTSAIEGFMRLEMMDAPFSAVLNRWGTMWLLTAIYFTCAVFSYRRVGKMHTYNETFG